MLFTGDETFRAVIAFAMSIVWEHSNCHIHEHISLSSVLPATQPTDTGCRQACDYQFCCIRLVELLDEYTQGR
jgi:hypothetical protein